MPKISTVGKLSMPRLAMAWSAIAATPTHSADHANVFIRLTSSSLIFLIFGGVTSDNRLSTDNRCSIIIALPDILDL